MCGIFEVKLSFFSKSESVIVVQSCPTLCDPWTIACQAPLSMQILQARILEWVAMHSSRGYSQLKD